VILQYRTQGNLLMLTSAQNIRLKICRVYKILALDFVANKSGNVVYSYGKIFVGYREARGFSSSIRRKHETNDVFALEI